MQCTFPTDTEAKDFEAQITEITAAYVTTMLGQYAQNPKQNWKAKDAAIYLVTALTVSTGVDAAGQALTNPLVPILPFFTSQILPELQTKVNSVLQADALKFATTFRRQVSERSSSWGWELICARLRCCSCQGRSVWPCFR
jgi:carbamate kinase